MERFKEWKHPIFDSDGWAYKEMINDYPSGEYGWRCQNHENLKLGKNIDIGCFSYLNSLYGIEIGDNVQIGSHCSLYSISTEDNKKGSIIIGENTTIGSHSLIMPGITIGSNSIIGAFSFCNKNIPDNVLAYGIPCKVVKKLQK
jgi:acetyltransferase-like isoleucine patch superfamily enzyme